MRTYRMAAALFAVGAIAAGCQTPPTAAAPPPNVDALLTGAGFAKVPSTTAQHAAALNQLPSNQLLKQTKGSNTTFVFTDPDGCNCYYVGNQSHFESLRQQVNTADLDAETLTPAVISPDNFQFGPLGSSTPQF